MPFSQPLILIPARMAASRLPGKPLADIGGKPMIIHVLERALEADLGPVVVATDTTDIADAVRDYGGMAQLTQSHHPSGSDRIFEALERYDPDGRHDVIVNLQGDLPTLPPSSIGAVLTPLICDEVALATLGTEITETADISNPNVVKIVGSPVTANQLRALYFTRAAAPYGDGPFYHHIGIYAYRRQALADFVALSPSPLECREKLEQLRALEAGMRIDAALIDTVPLGVDTPHDLEAARRALT